jgi:hypothetical protein
MKTRALNLVSSPVVARLQKLENSGFLTPAFKVMTRQSTLVADEVTRLISSLCASPHSIALMRNRRDFPQPTASWTAVALHRFPIYRSRVTPSKAHPQPTITLCACPANARERGGEASLSRFSLGTPSVVLPILKLVIASVCPSKKIFLLNLKPTILYTL